ncbi:hypothetical protein HDU96_008768 [Phlyctochytrium bullatum]|nr:hypothetical protein HDU96_008768 [Phlyctochytrium bullatum]
MSFRCAPDGIRDIHFDPQPFVEKPNDRTMNALLSQFHGRFPTNRELLELKMGEAVELFKVRATGSATPWSMALSLFLGTWRELGLRLETTVKELEAMVFGDDGSVGDAPPKGEVRRYFCTVDALKSLKKPRRKQTHPLAENVSDSQELCLAGFMVFQWHIPRRQIILCEAGFIPRDIDLEDPISHVSFCISSVMNRIEREAKAEKLPLPLHCGMWILPLINGVAPKLTAIGMTLLEEYVADLDEEERAVFADSVNVYGFGTGVKENFQYLFVGFDTLCMRLGHVAPLTA